MTMHFYSPTFSKYFFASYTTFFKKIKRFLIKSFLAKNYSFYAKKYYFLEFLVVQ